ncbi:MAG TPA: sigma-70 family RNA polymerase sigma factor [Chitinophagaceae bacterium]|nr:sigma-70 family RNA polymerase sigma factor [Chitinophagaceae bacterium]
MDHKTETFLDYKNLLFSIAYNMLGSVKDAEDIIQDTYLKWLEIAEEDVRYTKAYLVKMVTNKCINFMNSARLKREKYVGVWLPEPLLNYSQSIPETRIESYHALSIGILVLLEKLTPRERAIFLLKEVFSYDYSELAVIIEKTEDNCRQIFKRAKDHLGKDARRFEVDLKVHEKMLNNFLRAVSEGDLDGLIELLKEDIVFLGDGGGRTIPVNNQRLTAALKPVYGRENVSLLLLRTVPKLSQLADFSQEIIIANGVPSIISYSGSLPVGLVSIEHDGEHIRNIYVQTNPEKLRQFEKK